MARNKKLLLKTLAYIKAHPEEHNQEYYRCETGMCYAGWAITLAGGKWAFPVSGDYSDRYVIANTQDNPDHVFLDHGLQVINPSDRAERLLGITEIEGCRLFEWENTIEDIERIVNELVSAND